MSQESDTPGVSAPQLKIVSLRCVPMTARYAEELAGWTYPPPYERYSSDVPPEFYLDPVNGYFAVVNGSDELIAFRCFGADGQVPGGDYSGDALDTGGGLRPDLTGHGLGGRVIEVGLEFGRNAYHPAAFRVTVAAFNERALRVVRSLRFQEVSRFNASTTRESFVVLIRRPA